MTNKIYIGDGVYCEFQGYDFRLTTEDGISAQNEIFLEPSHIEALYKFYKDIIFRHTVPPAGTWRGMSDV